MSEELSRDDTPNSATIDGAAIQTEEDFHRSIHKQLFPEWDHYGNNPSALWDVLTTDVARPAGVVWIDAEASSKILGAEKFGKICVLLAAVRKQDHDLGLPAPFEFQLR